MRSPLAPAALAAGAALFCGTGVAAQETCDLLSSRSSTVRVTAEAVFSYIAQPVFGCDGGVTIHADSAVLNDVAGHTRFIGNFEYRDSTAFMTSDRADHYASAGRLIGVGNVHIIDEATGAVFEGDSTVLVGSGSRRATGELTIVGQRAHAVILVAPQSATPDSIQAEQDSIQVPPDSAAVATDSASAMDSTRTVPDSVTAGPASPAAPADPALASPDSATAASDSAQHAVGPGAAPPEAATPPPGATAPDSIAAPSDSTGTEGDSAAVPAPARDTTRVPYDIDAERIYVRGAGHLLATGNAELYNDEFRAIADSIEYLEAEGKLFLRGTAPRMYGFGAEYVLSGSAVDLDMDGSQVMARGDAALSGSEIDLTAPEIRVLMQDGVLDRIVAMHERPAEPEASEPGESVADLAQDSGSVADAGEGEPDPATESADAAAPPEKTPDVVRDAPAEALREATPGGEAAGEEMAGDVGAEQTAPGEAADSTVMQLPARPRAVAEAFELEGDSIEVQAPGEVLEQVIAVGNARGVSLGRDSLNTERTPEIARSDWVSGDTIIAFFQPVAAGEASAEAEAEPVADTAGGYQLDRLVARGQAASLYRMSPSEEADSGEGEEDTEAGGTEQVSKEEVPEEQVSEEEVEVPEEEPPENHLALHYVRGDLITIFMAGGEVTSIIVEGDARGVQLEPIAPPPPDSTSTLPPSTRR